MVDVDAFDWYGYLIFCNEHEQLDLNYSGKFLRRKFFVAEESLFSFFSFFHSSDTVESSFQARDSILIFSVLITKMFKIIKEIFAGQLVSSLARWISVYFTTIINYTGNETSRRISVLFAIQYILSKHYFLHSI